MKKNPYEEVLKDRKHTVKLLDYVCSLKMDLKEYPSKLEGLLRDKFIVTDEKGEDQLKSLVHYIIDWENDPSEWKYTGREKEFLITYILRNTPEFGLMPGFCILGLLNKRK